MKTLSKETFAWRWVCEEPNCNEWFITGGSYVSHLRTHTYVSCLCCKTIMTLARNQHHNHNKCDKQKRHL